MSLKDQNIEELFRTGLEELEIPVDDKMWRNISQSMASKTAASSSSAVTSATSTTLKTIAYVGISAVACTVAVLATLYLTNDNPEVKNNTTVKVEENQNDSNDETENIIHFDSFVADSLSDDAQLIEQIIKKEDVKTDPTISDIEKQSASKKVVVTSETPKYQKNSSWVDQFLTSKPKSQNYTNTTLENNVTNTSNESVETEKSPVKPVIEELESNKIIASIVALPVGGYAPLEVSFSQYEDNTKVHWDFGDGKTSNKSNPSHVFEKYGNYTVTLTILDEKGNVFKDFKEIEVKASSALVKIPNVFTPNNDGNNDYFKIEGKNIAEFQMAILSVNGDILYESKDIKEEWDGNDKYGNAVPNGTYVIVIKAKGEDGKKYDHKGTFVIKR